MEEILRQSREVEAEAERQRQREVQEAEAAAAAAEQARLAAEAERQKLAAALPAEPAAGGEGVVTVSLRLPKGSKAARRFKDSQPLQHVRSWVQTMEEVSAGVPAGQQPRFKLLSNFPRKVHSDDQQTLADLKLGKQILLLVEFEDEEED
jgi:hypothetical protein